MTRFNDILNGIKEAVDITKKTTKAENCGCNNQSPFPENEYQDDRLNLLSNDMPEMEDEEEDEEEGEEENEYKKSYYDMSVGSLRAIMNHAKDILDYLDSPMVKENLTAPHLQGMIAVAEDHLRSIHDFVMFVETDDDDYEESESGLSPIPNQEKKRKKVKVSDLPHYEYQRKEYPGVTTTMGENNRPGLWENIRKKKEKEGKKYKPAKPGDKDRPDPEQWKKLTKASYSYRCPKCGLEMEYDRQRSGYKCPNDGTTMQRVG